MSLKPLGRLRALCVELSKNSCRMYTYASIVFLCTNEDAINMLLCVCACVTECGWVRERERKKERKAQLTMKINFLPE